MDLSTNADASADVTATAPFRCGRCGCSGNVTLTDRASARVGGPAFLRADQRDSMRAQARRLAVSFAHRNVRELAAMVPCPQCRARDWTAVAKFFVGHGIATLICAVGVALSILMLFDDQLFDGALCLLFASAFLVAAIHDTRKRWRNALHGATWTDVIPGQSGSVGTPGTR